MVAHFIDHANAAVAELPSGPIEQAHAAVRPDQPVFDRHAAGADVLPAGKILAVEELLPFALLRLERRNEKRRDECDECDSFIHEGLLCEAPSYPIKSGASAGIRS